ncbi:MAG: nucleoside deaminase [Candidatus Acidiferrales bacterium]
MLAKQSAPDSFMARAIALSLENIRSDRGGPFAALVVKDGEIISEGVNCVASTNDPTAHAEIVAIREACRKLKRFDLAGCEIYATCEPCPMCLGAIYWARLAKIYFANTAADAAKIGFDDSVIYGEIRHPAPERRIPMIPLMRDDAIEVFHTWQAKPDKISY